MKAQLGQEPASSELSSSGLPPGPLQPLRFLLTLGLPAPSPLCQSHMHANAHTHTCSHTPSHPDGKFSGGSNSRVLSQALEITQKGETLFGHSCPRWRFFPASQAKP